jgi:glycosyltransferase involved in cell wall biosynthesis
MKARPVVGIDAGALMLSRSAPGTAKFVREQTQQLLRQPVPWDWLVAVPKGCRAVFAPAPGSEIVELEGRKYSLFATVGVGRLWRQRRVAVGFSPAGISAFHSPIVCNYFDSNLFEFGRSAVTSGEWARFHFLKWLATDTFRRAQLVFVNSAYCADVLRARFPAYRNKFIANPVGVSPAPSVPAERPEWASTELEQRGFVLCSSAFMDNKNQRRLIEAYVMLQNAGRVLPPLVLIGPCPPAYLDRVIRPAAARSPRVDEIVIPGHVSEGVLAWAFAKARMVVQPSFAEGFSSFSVFQAMQKEVPVACANTTSHPEAVGDAALLFDPSSVPAIAAAMARLLEDEPLRARLASAGLRRVQELTWSANAERVCAEISKIVEPSRG